MGGQNFSFPTLFDFYRELLLITALEPETAALFCMERKISKLETERVSDIEDAKLAQPQTQYMVVDIGGDKSLLHFVIIRLNIFISQY